MRAQLAASQCGAVVNGTEEGGTTTNVHEVTVLTRIEEKSSLDVSCIVLDLEARCAELVVLKEALLRKDDELLVKMASVYFAAFFVSSPSNMLCFF